MIKLCEHSVVTHEAESGVDEGGRLVVFEEEVAEPGEAISDQRNGGREPPRDLQPSNEHKRCHRHNEEFNGSMIDASGPWNRETRRESSRTRHKQVAN